MPPIANLAYLVVAVLFILAFKGLAHPRTAVRGNMLGSIGMLVAILATLRYAKILSWEAILGGLVLGSAIGAVLALKVEMTAMPQLVALLNGFGGGASVFVAGAALLDAGSLSDTSPLQLSIASVLSGMIGSVTFFGSLIAFAKLQGIGFVKDLRFGGQQVINAALLLVAIGCAVPIVMSPDAAMWYWGVVGASALLGLLVVLPIGGADMPVVICLLNSYSGLAASAAGFALGNNGLIISGSLVGASGLILTRVMCKAMNRSMTNVLFGVMAAGSGPDADTVYAGKVKATSPDEVAMLLDGAQRVVIVPGYGMAVAQAQHVVRDLMNLLEGRRHDCGVRHPPRGGSHARAHERAAGGGRRPVRQAHRDGGDQPLHGASRHRHRHRRQRRREPGWPHEPGQPDRRNAHHRRRQGPHRGGREAVAQPWLRRHSEPSLRRLEHPDDVR